MKILITGGSGFLGSRLAHTLLLDGIFRGAAIDLIVLADLSAPKNPYLLTNGKVKVHQGDLLDLIPELSTYDFDVIFHLAAAVSGECERNFDLGLRANIQATQALLEIGRIRAENSGRRPIFFFSSSVAVYGSDGNIALPAVIQDNTLPTPQSSYGIQKFVCEQLVSDYTRKEFVDGRTARLMTVSVRPGMPNGAASGFLSSIIREPLAGLQAICPVSLETSVALASPANTIAGIIKVASASQDELGGRSAINLPALTVSVREMLDALKEVAGSDAISRVTFASDEDVARIVGGWPDRFNSARAYALGLQCDGSFKSVIQQYISEQ